MASEYHPEVQDIADGITEECEKKYADEKLLFNCKIEEARKYMIENFEYENDWEIGYPNGWFVENLLLTNRTSGNKTKGDCIDFSITFCSLMKHVGISCIIRSTNGGHRIAVVRFKNEWIPLEPQSYDTGFFNDRLFQGFLI